MPKGYWLNTKMRYQTPLNICRRMQVRLQFYYCRKVFIAYGNAETDEGLA